MPLLRLLTCAVLLSFSGCGKNSSPSATAAGSSAAAAEAARATQLAELTQALRKFSVEQRRVPTSLDDLVSGGYIPSLPQPPPGKTFQIDSKNLQIIVK